LRASGTTGDGGPTTDTLTFDQLVTFLHTHDNYLLISHADPDGDAVGSELGLLAVLRFLGKRATILNSDACPQKMRVFDPDGDLHSLEDGDMIPDDLGQKTLILLDTSDFHHTRRAKDVLFPFGRQVVIIDHHTSPFQLPCPAYIDDSAAASCQIVFQIAEAVGAPLDPVAANALFMGIVFDTGSFIYPKTTASTFEAARKLVDLGVKPKEIHSALFETIEPSKMRLLAGVQATMRLLHDDRTAIQVMTWDLVVQSLASPEDAESFINYPLKCSTVQVSLFIKEVKPGFFRCSLRSKGLVDVSVLALSRGGGGHKTAAGFPCPDLPLAELEELLLQSVLDLYPKD
jgi:phosphoesterase RecJ-like protein